MFYVHLMKRTRISFRDHVMNLCTFEHHILLSLQVVVIIIICILSLLVLYMLFLLCLDPLMSRRPKTYLEQHNEEVNLVTILACRSQARPKLVMNLLIPLKITKFQKHQAHIYINHTKTKYLNYLCTSNGTKSMGNQINKYWENDKWIFMVLTYSSRLLKV